MSKKTIISIAVAILILGGLMWFARPKPMGEGGAARPTGQNNTANLSSTNMLSAEETSFDFSAISMTAGNVKHAFQVKNTNSEPVAISKIYTSCMCTTAILMMNGKQFGPYGMPGHGFTQKIGETLELGEEAIIDVEFDPAAHGPAGLGRVDRIVYIDGDLKELLQLKISANVVP